MEDEKLFTKEKLQCFLPDAAGLHLSSPLLQRVDLSPGSGQHLPSAGPWQQDAAHAATPGCCTRRPCPRMRSEPLLSTGWLLAVQTQGSILHVPAPWSLGRITPHLPSEYHRIRAEVMLLFLGHPPSPEMLLLCLQDQLQECPGPAFDKISRASSLIPLGWCKVKGKPPLGPATVCISG